MLATTEFEALSGEHHGGRRVVVLDDLRPEHSEVGRTVQTEERGHRHAEIRVQGIEQESSYPARGQQIVAAHSLEGGLGRKADARKKRLVGLRRRPRVRDEYILEG